MKEIILSLLITLVAFGAKATESRSGAVSNLYAAVGTNYGFRAVVGAGGAQCSTGGVFVYTNVSDDNYKAYVALLMLAYSLGKTVTVILDTSQNTCHIVEAYITN